MFSRRMATRMIIAGCVLFGLSIAATAVIMFQIYGIAGENGKIDSLESLKSAIDIVRVVQVASLISVLIGVVLHAKAKK